MRLPSRFGRAHPLHPFLSKSPMFKIKGEEKLPALTEKKHGPPSEIKITHLFRHSNCTSHFCILWASWRSKASEFSSAYRGHVVSWVSLKDAYAIPISAYRVGFATRDHVSLWHDRTTKHAHSSMNLRHSQWIMSSTEEGHVRNATTNTSPCLLMGACLS